MLQMNFQSKTFVQGQDAHVCAVTKLFSDFRTYSFYIHVILLNHSSQNSYKQSCSWRILLLLYLNISNNALYLPEENASSEGSRIGYIRNKNKVKFTNIQNTAYQ